MAVNDMVVRIIGDSRSVERSFARSSKAAAQFGREVDTTGRRIDSNAKKLSGFAKGAGVGFIAGAAISSLKEFARLASESEQVLGQTRVALEASGKSWAEYGDIVQDAIQKQSNLGFDDEALLRTFSTFVRQTDNVSDALARNSLAMDIARARFISLEQAASIVTKAALGQSGALRRIGIDARKGASGVELLTQLQEEFGGAAVKAAGDSATAFDRMNVQIENAKEAIGSLTLPVLTNFASVVQFATDKINALAEALGGMEKQSNRLTFGDLFTSLNDIPDLFRKSLIPPWEWDDVAESQAGALTDSFKAVMPRFVTDLLDTINEALAKQGPPGLQGPVSGAGGFAGVFAENIKGAIERAKELARLAIAEGNERIATDKAREAAEKRRDALKKLAEAQAEARRVALEMRQSSQFRALGLDESGGPLAPTIANLSKQLDQLKSRDDLSGKARGTIARIGRVLSGEFGKVTDRTRAAIRDLFQAIRSEFDKESTKGPLTKTTSLNSNKVLAGLGLAPEQVRELRARLSGINSAGIGLAGATRPTGNFTTAGVVVENQNTIVMDGDVVARNTTRSQQKTRRRNPRQKRGPNSGV